MSRPICIFIMTCHWGAIYRCFAATCLVVALASCAEAPNNFRAEAAVPSPEQAEPTAFGNTSNADNDLWQFINADHQQRKSRLQRLSNKALIGDPKFYEYLISSKELPGFPVDMPVLRVVFEEKVFFDTAHWDIRPEANTILDVVAASLREEPREMALFVAGHTDSRGSDQYNLDLSVRRANSVGRALLQRGIGHAGVWRIGFGKSVPLRPNDSDANMAMNRRVEFILASKPAAVAAWLAKQVDSICAEEQPAATEKCEQLEMAKGTFTAAPVTLENAKLSEEARREVTPASSPSSLVEIKKVQPFSINLTTKTIAVGRPLQ